MKAEALQHWKDVQQLSPRWGRMYLLNIKSGYNFSWKLALLWKWGHIYLSSMQSANDVRNCSSVTGRKRKGNKMFWENVSRRIKKVASPSPHFCAAFTIRILPLGFGAAHVPTEPFSTVKKRKWCNHYPRTSPELALLLPCVRGARPSAPGPWRGERGPCSQGSTICLEERKEQGI